MAHTKKPLAFVDKVIDCREKLGKSDPSFHSSGTFKEFWNEYKEKLGAIWMQTGNSNAPQSRFPISSCANQADELRPITRWKEINDDENSY